MYNRYVRNASGGYDRLRQPEPPPPTPQEPPHFPTPPSPPPPPLPFPPPPPGKGLFEGLLDRLKLDNVDSGDLLLLAILFLLFRQDADEEALIALGLLLIL